MGAGASGATDFFEGAFDDVIKPVANFGGNFLNNALGIVGNFAGALGGFFSGSNLTLILVIVIGGAVFYIFTKK